MVDSIRLLFELAREVPAAEREGFVRREAEARGLPAAVVGETLALFVESSAEPHVDPRPSAGLTLSPSDGAEPRGVDSSFGMRLLDLLKDKPEPGLSLGSGDDAGIDSNLIEELRRRGSTSYRYALEGEVGAGGMGKVYRVRDKDLRRTLALKVMIGNEDRYLDRFVEEAQITGQLDHPGIVPIHEIGVDARGRVFFTMKLVKGETLKDVFDKAKLNVDGWNTTRILGLIQRVCEAMAFAHEKGVIHRDLKPANIMVGAFGEVYVMDFGLARVMSKPDTRDLRIRTERRDRAARADSKGDGSPTHHSPGDGTDSPLVTMDGDVVGTPYYMPPEQAEGDLARIGPASDVYAVGAILYHLLSGAAPYTTPDEIRSSYSILHRVIEGPPDPIARLAPTTPAELLAIAEKAMAREIGARYPSMTALSADLRAYLEGRVVSAYATGAIAELKKWMQRNPALAAAAGVLVAVLAAASLLLAAKNREIHEQKAVVDAKNVEVTRQKAFAESRKAEFDQLAGKVHLERAMESERSLYPAWPEKIPAMERWLAEDAKRLHDLKPSLEATLAELRTRAMPWSAEDRERDRRTHPRHVELELARSRLDWLTRSMAIRAAKVEPAGTVLPEQFASKPAVELDWFARTRVDLDFSKRVIGEEAIALAVARLSVAKVEAGDTTSKLRSTLDTLAWACFANGLDEPARAASARALELAPADLKSEYRKYSEYLEKEIAACTGEAGARLMAELESKIADIESAVSTRRTYDFEDESQMFLYATLSGLSDAIMEFEDGAVKGVEQRLTWARRIADLTTGRHPNAKHDWAEARAAIAKADDVAASKLYRTSPDAPFELSPQVGLVPIGMNPMTKLWEFYDLRSACDFDTNLDPALCEIPTHRADGSLQSNGAPGIVFVLVPGGTFLQGSQKTDTNAPNHDPDGEFDESRFGQPTAVRLDAFFLSKYETTQAQWNILTGESPSLWLAQQPKLTGPDHPVEFVSWEDCARVARECGFSLPTEAQWEYACRAGTGTPFSFGPTAEAIARYANIRDLAYATGFSDIDRSSCEPVDDGEDIPSRVGLYAPNSFGFFDMHGNVYEWCQDNYGGYSWPAREHDGLRQPNGASARVQRGGSYNNGSAIARSSYRGRNNPDNRDDDTGVRFARKLIDR